MIMALAIMIILISLTPWSWSCYPDNPDQPGHSDHCDQLRPSLFVLPWSLIRVMKTDHPNYHLFPILLSTSYSSLITVIKVCQVLVFTRTVKKTFGKTKMDDYLSEESRFIPCHLTVSDSAYFDKFLSLWHTWLGIRMVKINLAEAYDHGWFCLGTSNYWVD